jgi:two-component system, sporulation sensor kinase E
MYSLGVCINLDIINLKESREMNNTAMAFKEKKENKPWEHREKYHDLHPEERINILIIDDDPESVSPLKKILVNYGCHVHIAKDGFQGVEYLSHESDIKLVFLDWNMPRIEGGETIVLAEKTILEDRNSHEFWLGRSIPVVTYTAEDSEKIRVPRVPHFSFVDHWPKSMGPEKLFFQVREILAYIHEMSH